MQVTQKEGKNIKRPRQRIYPNWLQSSLNIISWENDNLVKVYNTNHHK